MPIVTHRLDNIEKIWPSHILAPSTQAGITCVYTFGPAQLGITCVDTSLAWYINQCQFILIDITILATYMKQ